MTNRTRIELEDKDLELLWGVEPLTAKEVEALRIEWGGENK